tara:strand:- start:402 stop:698 length:297 start_codon:yes stop_codon:yes gene_type:complete
MTLHQHVALLLIQFRRAGVVADSHKIAMLLLMDNPRGADSSLFVTCLSSTTNTVQKILWHLQTKGMVTKERRKGRIHVKLTEKGRKVLTVKGAPQPKE